MMFVGVSKFRKTNLILVDPGVKINGTYCHDVLLSEQLLPVMCDISNKFFIFQRDSARAHRACETVSTVEWEKPAFMSSDLWLPTVQSEHR